METGGRAVKQPSDRSHRLQCTLAPVHAAWPAAHLNLLAIETSTEYLSLAACHGETVYTHHVRAGQRHAEMILGAVSDLLARAELGLGDLHGVAYGEGPGSFTGLRIACGVVQGLALARGLKVIGVSTLLALADGSVRDDAAGGVYVCLDARMGEVYYAACRRHASRWQMVHAPGVSRPQNVPIPDSGTWSGLGSGFAVHGDALRSRLGGTLGRVNATVFPTAEAVLRLASPRFGRGEGGAPEDAIPVYFRDKVALKKSER